MAAILIVDDHPVSRKYLVSLLHSSGHLTFEATSGVQGLELLAGITPDLAIVDLCMPEMDGLEFARCVKDSPWGRLPLIFYSALFSEQEARTLARVAGQPLMIGKPASIEHVLETVNRALGLAEAV